MIISFLPFNIYTIFQTFFLAQGLLLPNTVIQRSMLYCLELDQCLRLLNIELSLKAPVTIKSYQPDHAASLLLTNVDKMILIYKGYLSLISIKTAKTNVLN